MRLPLEAHHVLLNRRPATKEDVIREIGEVLLASGAVTPRYVAGMFEKEKQYSTWLTDGVALPHGTSEVKREVLRSAVVVAQIPGGVDWGGGNIVHVAFGVAGKGDEHLALLATIAAALEDERTVGRLRSSATEQEVIRILETHG
jgi:mannitol/fructose-specific phosphotransferase system IIA component